MKRALLHGLTGALLIGCSSFFADAATVDLETFLAALSARPELVAAEARVQAAEANLAQAQPPAALDLSVSSQALVTNLLDDARVDVGVTAYPFVYGQRGDTVRLRELELEGARLDLREARAGLEARALENVLSLDLAERTLALTRTAAAAASRSLEAMDLRYRRGVATMSGLRDAQAGQRRTQNLVLNAEADLMLAKTALTGLVGGARLAVVPELAIPEGASFSLRRAELAVALAQIGEAGAARRFYPVAELNYAYDVSAEGRVTASVTSADLAPRVGYSFDRDGYIGSGALSLRVSATLSPDQFQNATRLGELLRAAQATLQAAEQNAVTDEALIRNRWAETGRGRELGTFVFRNAEKTLTEVRQREVLGVGTPLETQAAAVALAEVGLELREARREQFAALLDLYEFYGLPVSETLAAPQESP